MSSTNQSDEMTTNIINIITVFDTDAILAAYPQTNPSSSKPVKISSKNRVFMVTEIDNVMTGQAGNELKIKAHVEDIIRWRATTITVGTNNSVEFFKFVASTGESLIRDPRMVTAEIQVPLPNEDNPLNPGRQTVVDSFWQTTARKAGNVTYHFQFMILDRNGKVLGYYTWDPYIVISN